MAHKKGVGSSKNGRESETYTVVKTILFTRKWTVSLNLLEKEMINLM